MKRRLIAAFTLLFALFSIGIGASLYFHWDSSRQMRRIITSHQIEELRGQLSYRLHQSQRDLQASGTIFAAQLDQIIANVEELDRAVESCNGCHHDEVRHQAFQTVASLVRRYKSQYSTFITAYLNPELRERLLTEANATAAELNLEIDGMLKPATAMLAMRTQQAVAQVDRSWQILTITLGSTFILAVLTTVTLVRGITEPIQTLLEANHRIHRGELGYRIQRRFPHEFGLLTESFNEMSTELASNRKRLDNHVARLRQLNQAVFSLYATPDQETLRERLARAMDGLLDAEVAGTVLAAGVENVFVMSLDRRGSSTPTEHHAVSAGHLEKVHTAAGRRPIVGCEKVPVAWPFESAGSDRPFRNFMIAWIALNGELRGGLIAADKSSGDFVEDDVQILEALAKGVAEALENIRLFRELQGGS